MDIATTTLVLVGVAVMGGYIGLRAISEKIDDLHEDIRGFAKMDAEDSRMRDADVTRRLGRIEGFSSASYEGVTDIRNTLEDR